MSVKSFGYGKFIDAKDTRNLWCVATVKQFDPVKKSFTVNYEGWSSKWDATFHATSSKLAPFRRHSTLYTGQPKEAIREWDCTPELLETTQGQLEALDLGTGDAYTTTQLLRGQVFTLVDVVLTSPYSCQADQQRAVTFLEAVLAYICKWLDRFPTLAPFLCQGTADPDLFLRSDEVAVAMAWPELWFTLARLFRQDPRTAKFGENEGFPQATAPRFAKSATHFFLNRFGELGGLESVLQLLSFSGAFPLPVASRLPVFKVAASLRPEVLEHWAANCLKGLAFRIEGLEAAEVQRLPNERVDELFKSLEALGSELRTSPELSGDTVRLLFILKLLNSAYMEKKLKGLNALREVIKRPEYRGNPGSLRKGEVAQWLIQNQVVSLLLQNSHPELVKRVTEVLMFLAKNKQLAIDQLELLWTSMSGQHESLIIANSQAIVDLSEHLSKDLRRQVVARFQQEAAPDASFIRLVYEFAKKLALNKLGEEGPFGLTYFFDLLQDSSECALQSEAADYMADLLKCPNYAEHLWPLLAKAFQCVSRCQSVPQNLQLCRQILEALQTRRKQSKSDIFKQLNRTVGGVVSVLVQNLRDYLEIVRSQAETADDPFNSCLMGNSTHCANIIGRLAFIEYSIANGYTFLKVEEFAQLWDLLALRPLTPHDAECFFEWANNNCQVLFTVADITEVFSQFFCNPAKLNFAAVQTKAYECFYKYFTLVNAAEKKLSLRNSQVQARTELELVGRRALFELLLKTESETVQKEASHLVVLLHTRICRGPRSKCPAIWGEFLDFSLEYLEHVLDNSESTTRLLRLLLAFLTGGRPRPAQSSLSFTLNVQGETTARTYLLDAAQTVGDLLEAVAWVHKQPAASVLIKLGTQEYDLFDEDCPLAKVRRSTGCIDFVPGWKQDLTRREFMGKELRLQQLLFAMLANDNSIICELAWTLLDKLPVSPQLRQTFAEFEYELQEVVQAPSPYKLVYCLGVLSELAQKSQWVAAFAQRSSLETGMDTLLNTQCKVPCLVTSFHIAVLTLLDAFYIPGHCEEALVHRLVEALVEVGKHSADTIVAATVRGIFQRFMTSEAVAEALRNTPLFSVCLETCLLQSSSSDFSQTVCNTFLELAEKHSVLREFYLENSLALVTAATHSSTPKTVYWSFLEAVARCSTPTLTHAVTELIRRLYAHPAEESNKTEDCILCGILTGLKTLVSQTNSETLVELSRYLLHDCLFTFPAKCKYPDTRRTAFALLLTLCSASSQIEQETLDFLQKFHESADWRTLRVRDWTYSSANQSVTGFVGLTNLGATCYMNACLQQLFTIESFKEGILQAELDLPVLQQVQRVFLSLATSERQYISTQNLCNVFTNWDGQIVNVHEQMDAEEFFNNFMDKIEHSLPALAKTCFGGTQVTQCIGHRMCTHRSERHEPFLTLQLQVKNKRSLTESLQSYVAGDLLEGANAYECDLCEAKVSAFRRVSFTHLPNILVVVLRRFEFNYDTMVRAKLNDYCEFPLDLDMKPFTQEGLENSESYAPDTYYSYKLRGIVVHTGTTESGHYISYIKTGDHWLEFNDTAVRPFHPDNIPKQCFGDPGRNKFTKPWAQTRNAYLLFYERQEWFATRSSETAPLEELQPMHTLDQLPAVQGECERHWRRKTGFDPEYCNFAKQLLTRHPQTIKFALVYTLTTLVRTQEVGIHSEFLTQLQRQVEAMPEIAQWLLETVSSPPVLRELFLDCPVKEKRRLVMTLVQSAVSVSVSRLDFLKRLLNSLQWAKSPSATAEYFEILFSTLTHIPEAVVETGLVSLLLRHFLDISPKYSEFTVPEQFPDSQLGYTTACNWPRRESDECDFSYLFATLGVVARCFTEDEKQFALEGNNMKEILEAIQTAAAMEHLFYPQIVKGDDEAFFAYQTQLVQLIYSSDRRTVYLTGLSCLLRGEQDFERVDLVLHQLLQVTQRQDTRVSRECLEFLWKASIPSVNRWFATNTKEVQPYLRTHGLVWS